MFFLRASWLCAYPRASVVARPASGLELNVRSKACLNTILRSSKPDPIFCSRCVAILHIPRAAPRKVLTTSTRTCRIDTILKRGLDFAKDLGTRNVKDLAKLIQVGSASFCLMSLNPQSTSPFSGTKKTGWSSYLLSPGKKRKS